MTRTSQILSNLPLIGRLFAEKRPTHHVIEHKVGDRYKIGQHLVRGGMGSVYRGTDQLTNQPIVLKEMNDPARADLLKREARANYWAAYGPEVHPNLAKFLGLHSTVEGRQYLVHEAAPGLPLNAHLYHFGQFKPNTALLIIEQITEALIYCRDQGIVHCDIKPENIVFDQGQQKATLIDLGIATPNYDRTMIGTLQFAPPEQLNREFVNEKADVFSLGLTLYNMIAQNRYGDEKLIMENRHKVVARSIESTISDDIKALIFRMTENDPEKRLDLDQTRAIVKALRADYSLEND